MIKVYDAKLQSDIDDLLVTLTQKIARDFLIFNAVNEGISIPITSSTFRVVGKRYQFIKELQSIFHLPAVTVNHPSDARHIILLGIIPRHQ